MGYTGKTGTQRASLLDFERIIADLAELKGAGLKPKTEQVIADSLYMAMRRQVQSFMAEKEQETKEEIIEGLESLLEIL